MIAPIEHQRRTEREASPVDPRAERGAAGAESVSPDPAGYVADIVGQHPVLCLAAATSIGALAGWIVKRKLLS